MNIKYNQLCIRNAEKKDCEQLAVWWNDGTVMAHAGFPNGLGTSAAEIEKQIADDSDETRRRLIIEYNDVRIGEMSFYVFENHRYEIGIKICESDYQEKGIGRVVLSMLIEESGRAHAPVCATSSPRAPRSFGATALSGPWPSAWPFWPEAKVW